MNSPYKLGSIIVVLFGIAAVATPVQLQASGSYCVCLPKPPIATARGKVDRDKFDLGQKVFNGRTAAVQADAASQRPKLQSLQAQLPASVAKKKNLMSLAGKLSDEQLDALGYFVENRYPKSK